MNVADDVERAMLAADLSFHNGTRSIDGRFDFFGAFQHENMAEAFASEPAERPPQLRLLLANDVRAEVAVCRAAVALLTEPFGQIQHDGDRQAVVLPGQLRRAACGPRAARSWRR